MSEYYEDNQPEGEYWAAVERERIGELIAARFKRFWREVEDRGLVSMWRASVRAYYGQDPDGGYANSAAVTFGGVQGELALIHTGDYRQLIRSMHTLATSQRPAIEVTAMSNDPEAISQTITARQVLEYDLEEGAGGLEEAFLAAHERALVAAEGYVVDEWDPDEGDPIGLAPQPAIESDEALPEIQPPERVVHQGGPQARYKSPWDVAREMDVDRAAAHAWYIVRDRVHRWEYAARYPEHARTIANAPPPRESNEQLWLYTTRQGPSEYVELLTLYHVPTAALPRGRRVEVIEGKVLVDDPYPYEHMVVHPDLPNEELDQAVGYSDAWDLLALQQALNAVEGAILTTHDAGAVPNWIARRGQSVDTRMLTGGLRVVEWDGDPGEEPPGLMTRPEVRPTDFQLSEHITARMQRNSGINSVVRGDPDDNVKSGAYAALVASMAVQANNAQQRAYARLMRSVLNGRLKLYQTFASDERLIEIVGKDSVGHVKAFKGDDLRYVRRVRVELANPVLRTVQGKRETARELVEMYGPQIITPDRFLTFQQTGRLDDLENREATHKVNARRENELFRESAANPQIMTAIQSGDPNAMAALEGAVPKPLVCDHHDIHIREHLHEIDDPAVRMDPQQEPFRALVLSHVQAHLMMKKTADPDLLAATGQSPPVAPPGPPGTAPANDNGQGPPVDAVAPGGTSPDGEPLPNLPNLPMNPMSGERGTGLGPAAAVGG